MTSDTDWMKPHLDLANRMIAACMAAQTTEPLPSTEQIEKWKQELLALMTIDEVELVKWVQDADTVERLIYCAGLVMGKRSKVMMRRQLN